MLRQEIHILFITLDYIKIITIILVVINLGISILIERSVKIETQNDIDSCARNETTYIIVIPFFKNAKLKLLG